jgi:hypothetical protein
MRGSSDLKSKKTIIMKTKSFFSLAIGMLAMSMSVSAYTKDPSLCTVETGSWDASARTFKITGVPSTGIKAPWAAYVQDAMWASYTDITGTYTPGATTYTSARLTTDFGDPTAGGLSGQAFYSVAMFGAANNLPKPHNEDCSFIYKAQNDNCPQKLYCDKFNATTVGSIITLTGLKNCVADNIYMYADSKMFTNWASLPVTMDPSSNGDKGTVDATTVSFYVDGGTGGPIYPFAPAGAVYMNADDKGGPNGKGPNYCTKSFPVTSIENPLSTTVNAFPNPASVGQTVTVGGAFESSSTVEIYDLRGALLSNIKPDVTTTGLTFTLPSYASDVYVIKVTSASNVFSAKLSVK